jgi:hypothetical protein
MSSQFRPDFLPPEAPRDFPHPGCASREGGQESRSGKCVLRGSTILRQGFSPSPGPLQGIKGDMELPASYTQCRDEGEATIDSPMGGQGSGPAQPELPTREWAQHRAGLGGRGPWAGGGGGGAGGGHCAPGVLRGGRAGGVAARGGGSGQPQGPGGAARDL